MCQSTIKNDRVEENLKLVYSVVHKTLYPKFKEVYSKDDLIQIGTLGLMSAARRFDESRNIKFATYAVQFIIGYVYNYAHADSFIYQRDKQGGSFTRVYIGSLDEPIATDDNGTEVSLMDTLSMKYEEVGYTYMENKDLITSILSILKEKEREILNLVYVQRKTEVEAADLLNCSQSSVSKIKHKALSKLQKHMTKEEMLA